MTSLSRFLASSGPAILVEIEAVKGYSGGAFVFAQLQQEPFMSASLIFDSAPIGSFISWSDGTPCPPNRFNKKLAAWASRNGQGRLIRKEPARTIGTHAMPASFTVHLGDFGGGSVVLVKMHRTFSLASNLVFTVVARPAIGSILIFERAGENRELLNLAEDAAAADAWLKAHRYPDALTEQVTDVCAPDGPGLLP